MAEGGRGWGWAEALAVSVWVSVSVGSRVWAVKSSSLRSDAPSIDPTFQIMIVAPSQCLPSGLSSENRTVDNVLETAEEPASGPGGGGKKKKGEMCPAFRIESFVVGHEKQCEEG